jgi:hypothetical protein
MPSLFDSLLDGPFALTARPEPLPGDLRIGWGVALVVLILGRSRAKRASLQKLHFLAHAIRTRESRAEVEKLFSGALRPSDVLVRVEPWLTRALAFARAAQLIDMERGRAARLTAPGEEFLDALYASADLFSDEKQFLHAISNRATEGNIDRLMRMESLL